MVQVVLTYLIVILAGSYLTKLLFFKSKSDEKAGCGCENSPCKGSDFLKHK